MQRGNDQAVTGVISDIGFVWDPDQAKYRIRARHKLIVDRDPATGSWRATHEHYLQPMRDAIDRGYRRLIARDCQPNHLGNYRGKRTPRPSSKSLAPRERLARLQAHYLASAMTYRNPATKRGASTGSTRYAQKPTTCS